MADGLFHVSTANLELARKALESITKAAKAHINCELGDAEYLRTENALKKALAQFNPK